VPVTSTNDERKKEKEKLTDIGSYLFGSFKDIGNLLLDGIVDIGWFEAFLINQLP
jgi:hypothetical protein